MDARFDIFVKCIQKHPRFNELYDVLKIIRSYLKKPQYREEFQEYLNTHSNFLTWFFSVYGNKDLEFIIPKRSKEFTSQCDSLYQPILPYFAHILPYMFYFPQKIIGVEKQAGHFYPDFRYFPQAPRVKVVVTQSLDGLRFPSYLYYFSYKKEERGELCDYFFSTHSFSYFFRDLIHYRIVNHYFLNHVEFRFELQNFPLTTTKKDFSLVFYKDNSFPKFFEK